MEKKCLTFQKDLAELQKKDKLFDSLWVEVQTYESPSTPTARINKLEISLKDKEKRDQDAPDSSIEITFSAYEDQKARRQDDEAYVQELKNLEDEVSWMKAKLHDSIQRDMQVVFGNRGLVVPHCFDFGQRVEPFQATPAENLTGDLGTPTSGGSV